MLRRITCCIALASAVSLGSAGRAMAGPVLSAPYDTKYSIVDLGSVPNLPASYGGLTLLAGNPNTLLIGGSANTPAGVIDSVGLSRDVNGHITGFTGSATQFSTAPYIDGGLAYGPGGVLFFTGYPNNTVGEIKPGSIVPDKIITLTGVGASVGSLNFVPAGQPGAGSFKIVSYSTGQFYSATLAADGSGTYNITAATQTATTPGGPEGILYVPTGSPLFTNPSILVAGYLTGIISVYANDGSGNPTGTSTPFITGLNSAEGAMVDPVTGDFLFSTYGGGNHVFEVQGFVPPPAAVPEPATFALAALGGIMAIGLLRKNRRQAVN